MFITEADSKKFAITTNGSKIFIERVLIGDHPVKGWFYPYDEHYHPFMEEWSSAGTHISGDEGYTIVRICDDDKEN